ncbi:MAG: Nif3-like dinuclear metal center hexameric protein [Deltaproteobacteria bacterium]|nr:Nif3-like dinuclear metal center hexameric protein [Deltaproteobacteria bacterium]
MPKEAKGIRVREVTAALEAFAPLHLAEAWDNVGLLVGDPEAEVARVLTCIDFTREVLEEAAGAALVVAYHPPIFGGMKRVPAGSEVFAAIRAGIALYSPHTALDAAKGGTNAVLAEALGLTAARPLKPAGGGDELKLVTFVPEDAVTRVSEAVFAAGAGEIGEYTQCSFRLPGTGTFFGSDATNPAVGEKGRLEVAPEVRVETVIPARRVAAVVEALRKAHPYETPAFDLVRLQAAPDATIGMGRVGEFAGTKKDLVAQCKKALGLDGVLVAGSIDGKCKRVAVAAGAGAGLLEDALKAKADVFVTGELKHHDALKAVSRGMTVVATLHSNSERLALRALGEAIAKIGVEVTQSRADRDPYVFA